MRFSQRSTFVRTKISFSPIPKDISEGDLPFPDYVKTKLGENVILMRDYSNFGNGTRTKQREYDSKLLNAIPGQKVASLVDFVKNN